MTNHEDTLTISYLNTVNHNSNDSNGYQLDFGAKYKQRESPQREKISLLNFDPFCKKAKFLESPRSIEACRMLGVEEADLLAKTKEDFTHEPVPLKFKTSQQEFFAIKADFYEKNRIARIQSLLMAREKIPESDGYSSQRNDQSSYKGSVYETNRSFMSAQKALDSGKKQIEAMKKKHIIDVENIMERIRMKGKLDQKLEENAQKIQELKYTRQSTIEKREREANEAKIKRDERRKQVEKIRELTRSKTRIDGIVENMRYENKDMEEELSNTLWDGENDKSSEYRSKSNTSRDFGSNSGSPTRKRPHKLTSQNPVNDLIRSQSYMRSKALEKERQLRQANGHSSPEFIRDYNFTDRMNSETEDMFNEFAKRSLTRSLSKQKLKEQVEEERKARFSKESERLEKARLKVRSEERMKEIRNKIRREELSVQQTEAEKRRIELKQANNQQYIMKYLKEEEAKVNFARNQKAHSYHNEKLTEKVNSGIHRTNTLYQEKDQAIKEAYSVIRVLEREKRDLAKEFERMRGKLDKDFDFETGKQMLESVMEGSTVLKTQTSITGRSAAFGKFSMKRTASTSRYESPHGSPKNELYKFSTPDKYRNDSNKYSTPDKNRTDRYEQANQQTAGGSSAGKTKRQRRSRAERGNAPGEMAGVLVDAKNKYNNRNTEESQSEQADVKYKEEKAPSTKPTEEYSSKYRSNRFQLEAKVAEMRLTMKLDMTELVRLIDHELKKDNDKSEKGFLKSAQKVLSTAKLQSECVHSLMRKTNYLELPWEELKANKAGLN